MISALHGKIVERGEKHIVMDCGGLGYFIHVPQSVIYNLPNDGSVCTIFTILNISKTGVFLVGFLTEGQRACFQMLTSVSGAGIKAGLELLGTLDVSVVYQAIIAKDVETLTQVKGVGKKLAQRIILEWKDKVETIFLTDVSNDSAVGLGKNESIPLAIEALVSLGYKRKEAVAAVMGVDTGLSVEKIVSQALKNLY